MTELVEFHAFLVEIEDLLNDWLVNTALQKIQDRRYELKCQIEEFENDAIPRHTKTEDVAETS